MLPPVKFNMLGQMQLRGGSSSGGNNTKTSSMNSCNNNSGSPEDKPPRSSKTSTPASSSSSSASSLSPAEASTLAAHGSMRNNSSSSGGGSGGVGGSNGVNVHGNITLAFAPDAHHQINSAFAWQLANSSQSIDPQETTRSNNQSGCRGVGDGVAVGGQNLNSGHRENRHHHHHHHRKSAASFPLNNHFQHQQQHQHGIGNSTQSRDQHHQHSNKLSHREIIEDTSGEEGDDTDTTIATDTERGGSGARAESPLDFSTKKKFKPEPLVLKKARQRSGSLVSDFAAGVSSDTLTRESSESPCSRLRNILSMRSPSIPEDMAGTVLNLSKESPLSTIWCKSESRSNSNSNSCSPIHEHSSGTAFVQSNSPRPATIPVSMATTTVVVPSVAAGGLNGGATLSNATSSMGLPSWGSGVYSPSLSPILNQTVPANGTSLPLSFETSPTLFPHHIAAGATSPSLPFAPNLSLPLPNNGSSSSNSKTRATRPFKAYPKDPLSFSSVGLYGLPLGTAPGTTEAVIHQQSNQAYAEFRKQMLSSSQFGKSKRGGPRNNSPYPMPSDGIDDLLSDNVSMMRGNDSGSASDDGGSLTNGKNRMGKSEQQMKDEAYWERRRKNNEAAKRSRDARRAKEDEIAIRAAFLEQENLKLRFEVCALKSETAKLRCMLYSS